MAKKKTNSDGEMTFLEHLEEMRGVMLKSLLVFVIALIGVGAGFSYFNTVMLYPLNAAKKIISTTSSQRTKTPCCSAGKRETGTTR